MTELLRKTKVFILVIMLFFSFISGCSQDQSKKEKTSVMLEPPPTELLIYCGSTMIRPMTIIAGIIERQENCKITITKGGSGNLLESIIQNKTGDLYLPGSDRYHNIIADKHPGLVIKKVFVGQNKAVIMVQKGNPKNIIGLADLVNDQHRVVIGNPDSGSIGKETKKILTQEGIFKEVISNAVTLTTDSKDLLKVIKGKSADIIINWYAVSTWDDNTQYIEVIEIPPEFSKKKDLVLGLLKYSRHQDIAKKFMELASSEQGKKLFKTNGLYFEL
jgi:molybdate transport system substrate-binding protein